MPITLQDIIDAASRLEGVAVRTPLLTSPELDRRLGARVFLKAENLQHVGAFKFRGAYNRLVQLTAEEHARGVVAFSSGNHAQGIAYAARLLGMKATIVMPTDAPLIKREGTEALGAAVRAYDRKTESREEIAAEIADYPGAVLVPAFDDFAVMAGQGTCALEMVQQLRERGWEPDLVLSPVGPTADVSVPEIVHDTAGQVPQTGLLAFVRAELSEKKLGSVVTSVTHHPDKS